MLGRTSTFYSHSLVHCSQYMVPLAFLLQLRPQKHKHGHGYDTVTQAISEKS